MTQLPDLNGPVERTLTKDQARFIVGALPLATLPMSYRLGKQYDPDKALHTALNATCGPQISAMIEASMPICKPFDDRASMSSSCSCTRTS